MTVSDTQLLAILRISHDTSICGKGVSLRNARASTKYAALRAHFGPGDLLPLLRRNPSLCEEWLMYSENKQTSGGWYLTGAGEIGMIDHPSKQTEYDSLEEAVAEFVVRELDFFERLNATK